MGEKDKITIDDKGLLKVDKKANLANSKKERDEFEQQIQTQIDRRIAFDKKVDAAERLWQITKKEGNFKVIRPNWQYELDPEYLKTVLEIRTAAREEERIAIEVEKQKMDMMLKGLLEQRDQQKESVKEIEKEVGEKDE